MTTKGDYYDSKVQDEDRASSQWLADHGYIVFDPPGSNYYEPTDKMLAVVWDWLEIPEFFDAIARVDTRGAWTMLLARNMLPAGMPHSVVHHLLATAERYATVEIRLRAVNMMGHAGRKMS